MGITAVMRRALAVRQAWIMMSISIRPSLTSPGAVVWRMKTARERQCLGPQLVASNPAGLVKLRQRLGTTLQRVWRSAGGGGRRIVGIGAYRTILITNRLANGNRGFLVRIRNAHGLCDLNPEPISASPLSGRPPREIHRQARLACLHSRCSRGGELEQGEATYHCATWAVSPG